VKLKSSYEKMVNAIGVTKTIDDGLVRMERPILLKIFMSPVYPRSQ
jgi:hypothetical protein